jgi:hypothetical protein
MKGRAAEVFGRFFPFDEAAYDAALAEEMEEFREDLGDGFEYAVADVSAEVLAEGAKEAQAQRDQEVDQFRRLLPYWGPDMPMGKVIDVYKSTMLKPFLRDGMTRDQAIAAFGAAQPTFARWEVEGMYRLDADRRVPRYTATLQDAEASLAYDRDHAPPALTFRDRQAGGITDELEVEALTSRLTPDERADEIEKLRPFWGPGVTKAEAVLAYAAAHRSAA